MSLLNVFLFMSLISFSIGHTITVYNACPFTVWPGVYGNPVPASGGFLLNEWQSNSFTVGTGWSGRVWGRRDCDTSGHCQTGDCGNKIQCNGATGVPPTSLAEITFDGAGHQDFYDVSLVDGYDLPISIEPIAGTFTPSSNNGQYYCAYAGCTADLNANCPAVLQQNYNGNTIACRSACAQFNTDQYCCRGAYGTPQKCIPSQWPTNYAQIFKSACPLAYSYAYDDPTSTFTCAGSNTGYVVTFCPPPRSG